MLILSSSTDKLQVVTGASADVDTIVTFMDASNASPPVFSPPDTELHTITTATTTDICAAPTGSARRNVKTIHIRNTHATVPCDVEILLNRSATVYSLHKVTLKPGDSLEYIEGVGFFTLQSATVPVPGSTNFATAASAAGFASDTYITGSQLTLAAPTAVRVGRKYNWRFIVSKTAAGTAAPILSVRVGTAGTTADTARLTHTFGAGTAAIDRGEIEIEALFTTIGASAILRSKSNFTTNLQTTGLSSTIKALQVTSSAFDATVANSLIGLSWNGGTSASHTIEFVSAWVDDL
jgi:hypothetical protein